MAHTKAIGAGRYGKDSRPKYRGIKLSGGQAAHVGSIIVRQTGSSFVAGAGVLVLCILEPPKSVVMMDAIEL